MRERCHQPLWSFLVNYSLFILPLDEKIKYRWNDLEWPCGQLGLNIHRLLHIWSSYLYLFMSNWFRNAGIMHARKGLEFWWIYAWFYHLSIHSSLASTYYVSGILIHTRIKQKMKKRVLDCRSLRLYHGHHEGMTIETVTSLWVVSLCQMRTHFLVLSTSVH